MWKWRSRVPSVRCFAEAITLEQPPYGLSCREQAMPSTTFEDHGPLKRSGERGGLGWILRKLRHGEIISGQERWAGVVGRRHVGGGRRTGGRIHESTAYSILL